MKFGVREICNVTFKPLTDIQLGNLSFKKGQPVLMLDTAKTSTLEGAATTVYATGGRGNTRLIAWEGEKTLTFTVEDALLSPISFAMLSGAGLITGSKAPGDVHVHMTSAALAVDNGSKIEIDLTPLFGAGEQIDDKAPVFICNTDTDGSLVGTMLEGFTVAEDGKKLTKNATVQKGSTPVFVDFYVKKTAAKVSELQIDAENFAGNYYVEASTLFRRQADGKDLPAEITLPNVKIQSNFTFAMASTGDPSTFTFTMDAFPGYTYFDQTKKVLCVMQVVDPEAKTAAGVKTVMPHSEEEKLGADSIEGHASVLAAASSESSEAKAKAAKA